MCPAHRPAGKSTRDVGTYACDVREPECARASQAQGRTGGSISTYSAAGALWARKQKHDEQLAWRKRTLYTSVGSDCRRRHNRITIGPETRCRRRPALRVDLQRKPSLSKHPRALLPSFLPDGRGRCAIMWELQPTEADLSSVIDKSGSPELNCFKTLRSVNKSLTWYRYPL